MNQPASLCPSELARLEAGLPRLADWGAHVMVPFPGRRLLRPRVAWINVRWFLERQLDVTDPGIRRRVEAWLCESFAVMHPRDEDPPSAFAREERTLYADRYGSTNGLNPHGGSGRVCTVGAFQVKGCGVTPLAARHQKMEYSDGCCSLEEGVREAVYGEIIAAEFPRGVVPVIAILDTGLPMPHSAEGLAGRRALVVRPAAVRAAHAERAPLFKYPVYGPAPQAVDDAVRTRQVVRAWLNHSGGAVAALRTYGLAAVEQLVSGQIERLFSGGFFSSNVSIHGDLLDFGNTHVLPNWTNARVLAHVVGFGDELLMVRKTLRSLAHYFAKYGDGIKANADAVIAEIDAEYSKQALKGMAGLVGLSARTSEPAVAALADTLLAYFQQQQRQRVTYQFAEIVAHHSAGDTSNWLYVPLTEGPTPSHPDEAVVRALVTSLMTVAEGDRNIVRARLTMLARRLQPRTAVERKKMMSEGTEVSHEKVNDWIDALVHEGRRHWRELPLHLVAKAHVTWQGSMAIWCSQEVTGEAVLWAEGPDVCGRLRWFDASFTPEDLTSVAVERPAPGRWQAALPWFGDVTDTCQLGEVVVRFPMTPTWFEAPSPSWVP
jgi:hypothetical protein